MSGGELRRLDRDRAVIYATGAAHGKRVQALGGAKNHLVVMPDADLDQCRRADGRGLRLGRRTLHGDFGGRAGGRRDCERVIAKLLPRVGPEGRPPHRRADMGPLVTQPR